MNDAEVQQAVTEMITGSGGLHDFESHEWAVRNGHPDIGPALWIVQCLANPLNERAGAVLDAIVERRAALVRKGGQP